MTEWVAIVSKLKTEDNLWRIQPESGVNIGSEITIDFDSREERRFIDAATGKEFTCEVVSIVNKAPGYDHQYFPVELLDL